MPANPFTPLKLATRASLGTMVADSLRMAIYAGRFQPGERLGQIMVARELGVSQTTVRDAFASLEREGLVQRTRNQGAVVVELSPADVEEIISLRTTLEVMAIRQVVQSITPEQLEQLDKNIRTMQTSQGAERLAELDVEFHEMLVRFANHSRLLTCWQSLLGQLKVLLVRHKLRDRRSLQSTIDNHGTLVELLKARDENGAVAHVERQVAVYRVQLMNEETARPRSTRRK